ncbi:DUF3558 domain-containing protein [Nocardia sp. NPDC050697]|uniref:DUF3558 domain-containing protein n=1 Tax=Nocardia sp. NPDC050697 TaxID=3155158 RepID=UPI00340D8446
MPIVALGLLAGACGQDSPAADPSATPVRTGNPSIAVSVPAGPDQTGVAEQVRLDPCLAIGDATVTAAGFDPSTRSRSGDLVSGDLVVIGCSFLRFQGTGAAAVPTGTVWISVQNRDVDDIRDSAEYSIFATEQLAGREAVLYTVPRLDGECSAAFAAPDGRVEISFLANSASVPVPPSCDGIRPIAAAFVAGLDL